MDTSKIKRQLAKHGMIADIWCIEDVKSVRPDLTDGQCMQVLELCERRHDAEIGINWLVIGCHADDLFPKTRVVPSSKSSTNGA